MIVSDTAVNKGITVMVLAVIIAVFGSYCYYVLPRESDPDITIPNVFITTNYRGVSPTDMETAVTIEIEKFILPNTRCVGVRISRKAARRSD